MPGRRGGGEGSFRQLLLLDEPTLQGMADLSGDPGNLADNADQPLEAFLTCPFRPFCISRTWTAVSRTPPQVRDLPGWP